MNKKSLIQKIEWAYPFSVDIHNLNGGICPEYNICNLNDCNGKKYKTCPLYTKKF